MSFTGQLLLAGYHLDKLLEINESIPVRVKSSEHVVTEFLCIAAWEDLDVHFHKLSLGQLPVWTVL